MDKKTNDLLEDIKKLLILDLITRGVQAKDIGVVLGVGKSAISAIVPARQIKKSK
jgi:predicted transcriptional regulator